MTRDERIQAYADRKGITVVEAHQRLLDFALDTLDARRKGAEAVNARPDHAKHLARARQSRGGKR